MLFSQRLYSSSRFLSALLVGQRSTPAAVAVRTRLLSSSTSGNLRYNNLGPFSCALIAKPVTPVLKSPLYVPRRTLFGFGGDKKDETSQNSATTAKITPWEKGFGDFHVGVRPSFETKDNAEVYLTMDPSKFGKDFIEQLQQLAPFLQGAVKKAGEAGVADKIGSVLGTDAKRVQNATSVLGTLGSAATSVLGKATSPLTSLLTSTKTDEHGNKTTSLHIPFHGTLKYRVHEDTVQEHLSERGVGGDVPKKKHTELGYEFDPAKTKGADKLLDPSTPHEDRASHAVRVLLDSFVHIPFAGKIGQAITNQVMKHIKL